MSHRTSIISLMLIATAMLIGTSVVDKQLSMEGVWFFLLCAALSGAIVLVRAIKKGK